MTYSHIQCIHVYGMYVNIIKYIISTVDMIYLIIFTILDASIFRCIHNDITIRNAFLDTHVDCICIFIYIY